MRSPLRDWLIRTPWGTFYGEANIWLYKHGREVELAQRPGQEIYPLLWGHSPVQDDYILSPEFTQPTLNSEIRSHQIIVLDRNKELLRYLLQLL